MSHVPCKHCPDWLQYEFSMQSRTWEKDSFCAVMKYPQCLWSSVTSLSWQVIALFILCIICLYSSLYLFGHLINCSSSGWFVIGLIIFLKHLGVWMTSFLVVYPAGHFSWTDRLFARICKVVAYIDHWCLHYSKWPMWTPGHVQMRPNLVDWLPTHYSI